MYNVLCIRQACNQPRASVTSSRTLPRLLLYVTLTEPGKLNRLVTHRYKVTPSPKIFSWEQTTDKLIIRSPGKEKERGRKKRETNALPASQENT